MHHFQLVSSFLVRTGTLFCPEIPYQARGLLVLSNLPCSGLNIPASFSCLSWTAVTQDLPPALRHQCISVLGVWLHSAAMVWTRRWSHPLPLCEMQPAHQPHLSWTRYWKKQTSVSFSTQFWFFFNIELEFSST